MTILPLRNNMKTPQNQNKKNYIFINQTMSWSSAQQYCRKNYKDLAMIENQEENTEAQNTKPSNYKVWIGLYQEPWTWSDGSKSSFRNWDPSSLNNYGGNQHCGTENSENVWGDEDCSVKRAFICHQGEHLKKCCHVLNVKCWTCVTVFHCSVQFQRGRPL
uniref:C-type lectin domain-containing protein n=1 Tax=Oryzias latipes TaxID=8090 RepID=H2MP99_ORYLA